MRFEKSLRKVGASAVITSLVLATTPHNDWLKPIEVFAEKRRWRTEWTPHSLEWEVQPKGRETRKKWDYPLAATEDTTWYFKRLVPAFAPGFQSLFPDRIPTFLDYDGDGDLDALTPNRFREYVGTPGQPLYAEPQDIPYDRWGNVDIDGDGDLDLITSNSNGDTFFQKNVGTSNHPEFEAAIKNAFGLLNVGSDGLEFADTDGDGDQDAVSGTDGGFNYFENEGSKTEPQFSERGERSLETWAFGTPLYVDIDGDDDLDVFTASYYAPMLFENTGTTADPSYDNIDYSPFGLRGGSGETPVAFVDFDMDGDLDTFMNTGQFFINEGTKFTPLFEPEATNPFDFGDLGVGTESEIVDLDGDGDLDVFIFSTGRDSNTFYFENDGTSTSPSFKAYEINPFRIWGIGWSGAHAFADLDDDGDEDVLSVNNYGIRFRENTGGNESPFFETSSLLGEYPFGDLWGIDNAAFTDIDADGDFDVFLQQSIYGNLYVFMNIGSPSVPVFERMEQSFFGSYDTKTRRPLEFVDIDLDGDYDAFMGIQGGDTGFFENIGTVWTAEFSEPKPMIHGMDPNAYELAFADIDGDEDPDAFVGSDEGLVYYYENTSTAIPPDSSPPECGVIVKKSDPATGKLISVKTTARDEESGIYRADFQQLKNMTGYIDQKGPFTENDSLIIQLPEPDIEITGERIDMNQHGAIVVKVTNGMGLVSVCDPVIESVDAVIPTAFALKQNYPNPFNPETTIGFELPESAPVKLVVYDVSGRQVRTLVDESLAAGQYNIRAEMGDLPSGVYFYRLDAGSFRQVKHMVLAK